MMKNIKTIIIIVFAVDAVLIMISLQQGGHWLVNSQLSFLSSLFITIASFYSYKRVVEKRVALDSESYDARDEVEKIEDPYDLYSIEEGDEGKDLKEIIKEERAKVTSIKSTASNLAKTAGGVFSPFRLGSYLFLFVTFLYLVNNEIFTMWAYIAGMFVVPLSGLIASIMIGKKE